MKIYTDKVKRGLALIETKTQASRVLLMESGQHEDADSLDAALLWIREHAIRLSNLQKHHP